jgi:membrane-associated protein
MFDITDFIKGFGYLGMSAVVFAESGLLLGVLLPGDSLLFTAGFLSSKGFFDIRLLSILLFSSALAGDNFGYFFGTKIGRRIFKKEDSLLFKQSDLIKTQEFFEKHGGKTVVLARFMPVFRSLVPILAGVGKMNYKVFMLYNFLGAALWAVGVLLVGYFLGSVIPNVDKYIYIIISIVLVVSITPVVHHIYNSLEFRHRFKEIYKFLIKKLKKST